MADLLVTDEGLVVKLTFLEVLEGFHGSIVVPHEVVRAVRATDDVWAELRGIRAPGTGIPRVVAVGTRRGSFGKDFAAVHGTGPGVVVETEGFEFSRLIVTVPDPEAVVTRASGARPDPRQPRQP